MKDTDDKVSMDEIEAEGAVSLPNKEVLSLLDVNANVDLGLDLAAPVDLAAAANLDVAAPIEASAAANVLSPGAEVVSAADQHGSIEQGITGSATADAPQHAGVAQNSSASGGGITTSDANAPADGTGAPADGAAGAVQDPVGHAADGAAAPVDGATSPVQGAAGAAGDAAGAATGAAGHAADTAAGAAGQAAGTAGNAVDGAGSTTTGSADSLLNGGSLLDANVNIHANADVAAPVDGAVAANGNVAAPIDAAVGANVGSPDAQAEALAPQEVDISQNLDHVSADATANQDANVSQK